MAGLNMNGVFPVCDVVLKVGTKGLDSIEEDMIEPHDITSLSLSFDDGVEEWNPLDTKGWIRRLKTAKGWTIGASGKRNVGDPGNDYIDSLKFANGRASSTKIELEMPDGTVIKQDVVISFSSYLGDSTAVAELAFDLMSDGKPVVVPAPTVP